jgi:hypothetical protein
LELELGEKVPVRWLMVVGGRRRRWWLLGGGEGGRRWTDEEEERLENTSACPFPFFPFSFSLFFKYVLCISCVYIYIQNNQFKKSSKMVN